MNPRQPKYIDKTRESNMCIEDIALRHYTTIMESIYYEDSLSAEEKIEVLKRLNELLYFHIVFDSLDPYV
jgi:hypothetical protein